MEISLRVVLLIVVAVAVVAIIWDSWRRIKKRTDDLVAEYAEDEHSDMLEPTDSIDAVIGEAKVRISEEQDIEPHIDESQVLAMDVGDEFDVGPEFRPQQESPEAVRVTPAVSAVQHDAPQSIIALHVMARANQTFAGAQVLPVLLAAGLRFGEMSIFHRYVQNDPKKPVLFSVASAVKPGTFDIDTMDTDNIPGVTLFMTLTMGEKSSHVFEIMLQAAKQLQTRLKGDLLDANRHPLSAKALARCRSEIRTYEKQVVMES